MSVKFIEDTHSYISLNPEENIKWTSVTRFISKYKEPFDKEGVAEKCSKNKKSKWYGLTKQEILDVWANETERALELGNFYHNQRESDMLAINTMEREGVEIPIVKPLIENDIKIAPKQKLQEGIYPEHFAYLKSVGICGQADYVEVVNGKINIMDYKTNKEIKKESFKNWEGISKKMIEPLHHLDDCNYNHYTLQMSLYMYMMLKHNPKLKPGNLTIRHVKFKIAAEGNFGYPIHLLDDNNDPVVNEIVDYDVPYLKEEIISLTNKKKNEN
jgi:hypothetical protein